MGACRVAFFHKTVADFTSKHVFLGFLIANLLGAAVLGSEHRDAATQIVALQCEFGLDCMFKRLRQIFRRVKHSTVVHVGHVHFENVIFEFCLRSLNRNPSLSCNTTNSNF